MGSRNRNGGKTGPSGQEGPPERWADVRRGKAGCGSPPGGPGRAGPPRTRARPGSPDSHHLRPPRLGCWTSVRQPEHNERGSGEHEPHGRVRSKHTAGPGEAKAVKVVGNGGGGPKRAWNPATRRATSGAVLRDRTGKREPGSGFSGLGASEGQRTSGEDVREERTAACRRPGRPDRRTEEVLEGERKTTSGRHHHPGNRLAGGRAEHAKVHTAR